MTHMLFKPTETVATINGTQLLANDWGKLTKYDMTYKRSDGSEQRFTRKFMIVVMVRQFSFSTLNLKPLF